ncbi:hypothetical protein NA57DRAFT_43321 [Rhizodiscina lignyota]|uniref:Zn(2)-C6 fungal-type domain-containing protein n=1 Tax=Rhizodiscina lignyota TaxID=1504668 RepID=A0A9P4M6E4_9PEZI|nr:hypothetical protein NA57DRAFT_43321 [Rhizodiscina lignyota]
MADISSFTGKFRAQKDDSSRGRVTKRPRESYVCNPCRKSKLRCDRGQPCNSCAKRQDGAVCSYQRETNHQALPSDRLNHLESMIKLLMQNQASSQSSNGVVVSKPVTPPSLPQDPGPVDQTRSEEADGIKYVGSTHWSSVLDDIQELRAALGGSLGDQELEEPMGRETSAGSELIYGSSKNYALQQIISQHLPSKVEVDRLLSIFFKGMAYVIPFVHTYHFQRQYRAFWPDIANVNPLWLSTLFSICYLASLIGGANASHRSSDNDLVLGRPDFHTAAGQCLVLGEYHRPQQFALEALVLYAQSKNARSLDPSREAGAILGMVVRMAYEMGYHRDPDSFKCFTVFEGEMRRRFWAACKQMDLMLSFQLGLPSNIRFENSDTKPPRNLLDSDFDADTQILPPSRPENELTKLLWFIVKARLMPSFNKVCQDALSFKEKSDEEIIELDREIRQMHTTLPDILRPRPISESIADEPLHIMTRIYVDFIHLKCRCALHRKYMARGNAFSTTSCIEAGRKIVSQFIDIYKEFSPGGQLQGERWLLTNFNWNDFLLGVMVLCLAVHIRRKRGSHNSTIDAATENEILALLEQACGICVEKSSASRDVRRVSQAIRLTLNSAKSPISPLNSASLTPAITIDAASDISLSGSNPQIADLATLSLETQHNQIPCDEAAFGVLDPFNFMTNDISNMDFTMFDAQPWIQDEWQ